MENLLDVQKVAEILAVKPITIYTWVRKGLIPYYRLEKCLRFTQEDVESFVKERRIERKQ